MTYELESMAANAICHAAEMAGLAWQYAANAAEKAADQHRRPFVVLQPHISISLDGDQWCVLYGKNLQDGVAGFGATPAQAAEDFDNAWKRELVRKP
jgi:hypothetical protein